MNKTLKILIVDDEPLARRIIHRRLKNETVVESVLEAGNGDEALELSEKFAPDLIFLDIQMPGCDGFAFLEKLHSQNHAKLPVIIFVTAFDEYALKAFEFHALDYLLKPFDQNRFKKSFDLAIKQISAKDSAAYQQKLFEIVNEMQNKKENPEWVSVKKNDRILLFSIEDIMWIEAQGNYALLHLTTENNLVREKMDVLESKLEASKFIRIHRSTIVNISFIREFEDWGKGEYKIVMTTGKTFNVSKTYRPRLDKFFNKQVL